MKLPIEKIELAAAKNDVSRPYLNSPWLDVENKRLLATNGSILAILPAKVSDTDTTGPLPLAAIKAARNGKTEEIGLAATAQITTKDTTAAFDRSMGWNYPNVDQTVPEVSGPPTISLDISQLLNLAKAIQGKEGLLNLWVTDAESAVFVTPYTKVTDKSKYGVILPLRVRFND